MEPTKSHEGRVTFAKNEGRPGGRVTRAGVVYMIETDALFWLAQILYHEGVRQAYLEMSESIMKSVDGLKKIREAHENIS